MKNIDKNTLNKWVSLLANNQEASLKDDGAIKNDAFKSYHKTWKILEEMQDIEQFDTDKAWNKVYSKIADHSKGAAKDNVRTFRPKRIWAYAASIMLLVGIGGYLLMQQKEGTVRFVNNSQTAQLINLPDGSKVFLNTRAELHYAKSFGKETRDISLKGEAFFEVTKDKSKPFLVHTNHTFIKVVGTSFNVNASTEAVEVVVKTGRVEVYKTEVNATPIILEPGDRAIAQPHDEIHKQKNTNLNYLSWMDKKLIFKALPLSEVISDVMQAYHCQIELEDTSLHNLKITSTFDNDSLDDVLTSISLALNLHVEKEGKKYILVSD